MITLSIFLGYIVVSYTLAFLISFSITGLFSLFKIVR